MSPQIWIEGIGSTNGLFLDRWSYAYGETEAGNPRLLCYTENDIQLLPYSFDIDTNTHDCWGWPLGSGIVENTITTDVKLYPNPATDQINLELIDFAQWENSVFTLYNVHGVRLQSINILSSITPINLVNYSSGLYFIEIRQQNGRKYYSKFIKN
jgi:hypothetical protein